MSRRLQDLFWELDLTSTEQLVAQRLAWHADDRTGKCWPGIASLCAKTGLGERAVQKAIQSLKAQGHLTREESRGLGVIYFIHPRTSCAPSTADNHHSALRDDAGLDAPASSAPVQEERPRTRSTPAPDAPTPARRAPKQVRNPSGDDGNAGAAPEQAITGQRGRRIDVDWQPTQPLPVTIAKVVAGWPPGRLDEQLEQFRDFWLADAGQRATKRDWDRTWWNRLRIIIDRDRDKRHGHRPHHHRSTREPHDLSPMARALVEREAGRAGAPE